MLYNIRSFLICMFLFLESYAQSGQLPRNVLPENYNLQIITKLADNENDMFNFEGKVKIRIKCVEPTDLIILNSLELDIMRKSLSVIEIGNDDEDHRSNEITDFDLNSETQTLKLKLKENLEKNHIYELNVEFSGNITDGLSGFYRSSYVDSRNKEKKWLAVTQFEATDARRAFPCFDQPDMKATFEISIGRLKKYNSLSNMPLAKTEPIKGMDGWVWDRFEKTFPMSTYIVAYMVSDFNSTLAPQISKNDVTFRTWCREELIDLVDFANEVGPRALAYFEDFFNVKYPLPKQDMVAVPDFSAGAMENWGLITYRETLLLFHPNSSSFSNKNSIASVISHELAHQWFGNLVTMKWWTDLWLNEGFATYMASLAVEHLYPKWKNLDEETIGNMISVFSFDSLKSSHPVSVPIEDPKDIREIFDTISYDKGSYLLSMMANFLGEETFRKGVSNYLEKHKYGNAEQDDLWMSLTAEAHRTGALPGKLTVKAIMDTWTLQTGYPIVTVTRDYKNNSAIITQERYLRDTDSSTTSSKMMNECWWIPLSYTDEIELQFDNKQPKKWLSCPSESLKIEKLTDEQNWIIFNVKAAGLYRVNYDQRNWEMLVEALNGGSYDEIPVLNRVQLIIDSADLAATKRVKYETFFDIIKYLEKETEYLPWNAANSEISYLYKMLRYTSAFGAFKEYMKNILQPAYLRISSLKLEPEEKERLDKVRFQTLIFSSACFYEIESCVAEATRLFKNFMKDPKENPIPTDFRASVYCNGIRHGGEKEWKFLWKRYKMPETFASEKSSILNALGCTKTIWMLQRYLEWSLDSTKGIRKQDMSSVFMAVARNDIGYHVAKSFFQTNIKKIHEALKPNTNKMSRYLSVLAKHVVTTKELEELQKFINEHNELFDDFKKGVQQALESATLNVQWQHSHLKQVQSYFNKYLKNED